MGFFLYKEEEVEFWGMSNYVGLLLRAVITLEEMVVINGVEVKVIRDFWGRGIGMEVGDEGGDLG